MKLIYMILFLVFIFTNLAMAADTTMDDAWGYYLKSDYSQAIEACRAVSKNTPLGDSGHYLMGISFLKLGKPEDARENFEFIIKNYPKSKLTDAVMLGIADSFLLQGDPLKSEEHYKILLKDHPSTGYVSMAYLNLGKAQRKQGKFEEAEKSFYKIIQDYPQSLEIKEAKEWARKKHFFTVQVGAFSKRENAVKLADHIKSKGYYTTLEKVYEDDKILYKVKTGRYNTKKMVDEEIERLKRDGFKGQVIS